MRLALLAIGLAFFLDRLASWGASASPMSAPALGTACSGILFLVGFVLLARALGGPWRLESVSAPLIPDDRLARLLEAAENLTRQDREFSQERSDRLASIAEIRLAVDEGRLDVAGRLLDRFRADHPEAGDWDVLTAEIQQATDRRVSELRSQIDASRAVGDADRVMDLRDEISPLLSEEERRAFDRQTLSWVMGLIQRRLRSGTVRTDVASLAARVAERFGDTLEGASLRASLPTLRRSAGLCPKCAKPYNGAAEACLACRKGQL